MWDVNPGVGLQGSWNSGISAVAGRDRREVADIYIQVLYIRKLANPIRGAGAILPVGRRGGLPLNGFLYISQIGRKHQIRR